MILYATHHHELGGVYALNVIHLSDILKTPTAKVKTLKTLENPHAQHSQPGHSKWPENH